MKRYVTFFVLGPFLGGFLLLFASTVLAHYWTGTVEHGVGNLLSVFFRSLPYYYLFGFVPVMVYAAIDDILSHVRKIGPVARMLLVGAAAFLGSVLLYGFQGGTPGKGHVVMIGMAGLIPVMLASWLSRDAAPSKNPGTAK